MIATLALPPSLREELAQAAKGAFPRECCGLVEGVRDGAAARAVKLHPMPNLARGHDRFEIDPAAQITLLRALRGTGRTIIGCYHSHPNGRPEPSPRDIEGADEINFLWLIAAVESAGAAVHLACFAWNGTDFSPVIVD
ncbi:MAG TPA: M67 family metallopeptidase [Rhizomicrobium sp.]|nr:M67 family metallopeptidase [Rhizomicrobium sp.]